MSSYILQQILNGLLLGSLYALVAIGFSMIYGIVRLINFAHGDVAMLGAYATLGLFVGLGLPFPVTFLMVAVFGFLIGIAIDTIGFRPMRHAPQVTRFITSLALSIFIQNASLMGFGTQPKNFSLPDFLLAPLAWGNFSVRILDLIVLTASVAIMAILVLFVHRTKMGIAMRATAENLPVARLMGIDVNRIIMLTFGLSCSLASIAGLFWAAKFGQIDPLMGFVPGLKAFLAAVIGGVGSLAGAMLGGFMLGMAEVLLVGLLPPEYSSFRDGMVFSALILFLLFKPNGLLGRSMETRA